MQLLKKHVGSGLVDIKHDMHQEILSCLKFGNVFPCSAIEDKVRTIQLSHSCNLSTLESTGHLPEQRVLYTSGPLMLSTGLWFRRLDSPPAL